ncbi:hypothetical protein [Sphingosinicella soli]|uniref:Uncharacterized protein n=1 Tax=Sphingosinicella soli TaxID=333708 RepID=A0A7W7B3Q4_9SPHN|nr:hypothetical protein [Sphingosinicella soli]MBB4633448.1 hypothetical protein [Sphingosinicella soli]
MIRSLLLFAALSFVPAPAMAEGPACDTGVRVRGCRADLVTEGRTLTIRTATDQCAVVDWTLDGAARSTVVTDGEAKIDLGAPAGAAALKQCSIVKDLRGTAAREFGTSDASLIGKPAESGGETVACKGLREAAVAAQQRTAAASGFDTRRAYADRETACRDILGNFETLNAVLPAFMDAAINYARQCQPPGRADALRTELSRRQNAARAQHEKVRRACVNGS